MKPQLKCLMKCGYCMGKFGLVGFDVFNNLNTMNDQI
jgi:hypothetical protein